MPTKRCITALALALTLAYAAAPATAQEPDVLSKMWEHEIGASLVEKPKVMNLFVGDINNDGKAEVSAATTGRASTGYTKERNSIYVYSGNGSLYWKYPVDDVIKYVMLYDINNDQNLEHIVSSSQKLEKIQRGTIRVIGWNGEKLRSFDSTSSMDNLAVADIDGDRYYEIAVGSENKVFLYQSYGELLWTYPQKGKGLLNGSVGAVAFGDVDDNEYKEIVAGANILYYLDKDNHLMATMDLEPNIQDVRKGFKSVHVLDLSANKYNEVLAVTKTNEIHSVSVFKVEGNAEGMDRYNRLELMKSWVKAFNCDIDRIIPVNADADPYSEMLFICSDQILKMMDNTGLIVWDYVIDGDIRDASITDMDEDKVDDILVASSSGTLYLLDLQGNFKWKYSTNVELERVSAGDINADKQNEVLILSKTPSIVAYEPNQTFTLRRRADMYYRLGQENYISSNWKAAREYLLSAKSLYSRMEYTRGVEDSQALIAKIDEKEIVNKRKEADLFYDKAQEAFIAGEYRNAQVFVKNAKEIYMEFGDIGNAQKCELLEIRIENALSGNIPPETLPMPELNKTTTAPPEESQIDWKTIGIVGLVIIVIIFILSRRREGEVEYIDQGVKTPEDLLKRED